MFDPNKIKATLESLRANAILLRDKGDLLDISAQALELQMLRAYADLDACVAVIGQLSREKDNLAAEFADLKEMVENAERNSL